MTAAGRVCRAFVIVVVVALLPTLAAGQERPGQAAPPGPGARPILIRELAVQGNRRVQEALILGRIRSVVGVPFNPSQASDDVRSIFTLGFFDDVQLKVEDFEGGVKLTFVVMVAELRLPELLQRVRALEHKLERLTAQLEGGHTGDGPA